MSSGRDSLRFRRALRFGLEAEVAEPADAADLKSAARKGMGVQISPSVPSWRWSDGLFHGVGAPPVHGSMNEGNGSHRWAHAKRIGAHLLR